MRSVKGPGGVAGRARESYTYIYISPVADQQPQNLNQDKHNRTDTVHSCLISKMRICIFGNKIKVVIKNVRTVPVNLVS